MKARLILNIGICVYLLIINYCYIYVISPVFYYNGLIYKEIPVLIILIGLFISLLPSWFLPITLTRPSHTVIWILYLLVVSPSIYIMLYTLYIDYIEILTFYSVLVISFIILVLSTKLPKLTISLPKINISFFWFIILSISMLIYSYLFNLFGFKFNLAVFKDLTDAYEIRESYREVGSTLASYFINWQSKVFNFVLIAIGLYYKKRKFIALGLIGQLMLFMISGHKTFLFSILLLLGLLQCLRLKGENFGIFLTYGLAVLVFITTILDKIFGYSMFSSLFVRRLIVVPSHLTGLYYDYFVNHEKTKLAHSILKGIFDYPYTVSPPFLIGEVYFNKSNMSANANLWADGYANFGLYGVVMVTLLLAFLLWIYDSMVGQQNIVLPSLFLGMSTLDLTNTSLLTTLLTHGMLIVFLVVAILPNKDRFENKLISNVYKNEGVPQ